MRAPLKKSAMNALAMTVICRAMVAIPSAIKIRFSELWAGDHRRSRPSN
jgi:hypothetical protein